MTTYFNSEPPRTQNKQTTFSFLLEQLLIEIFCCNEPLTYYAHPPPSPNSNNSTIQITNTTNELWITSYNLGCHLTQHHHAMHPRPSKLFICTPIYYFYTRDHTYCHHFTKHIQNLFPQYKFYFNNTHNITQASCQRMTYKGHRGGVITLIHNKYVYPNNLFKSPTHATISSSFLQSIYIANEALQLWLLVNLYVSSQRKHNAYPYIHSLWRLQPNTMV